MFAEIMGTVKLKHLVIFLKEDQAKWQDTEIWAKNVLNKFSSIYFLPMMSSGNK